MLSSVPTDRVTIGRSTPSTDAPKGSRKRLTVSRMMVIIAIIALAFGAALQLRSWFWAWFEAVQRSNATQSMETFSKMEAMDREWAGLFLRASWQARLAGNPADALLLEEAAATCLRRARFDREVAAYWGSRAGEGPPLAPASGGRAGTFSHNADGHFAYRVVLPILQTYDARTPAFPNLQSYDARTPAFDEFPGDR